MPVNFNGLSSEESLRGVQVKDANGFQLTDCPFLGESDMVLLHRGGQNSVLTLVNASPVNLMEVLGCDLERARQIIAWAVERSYPAYSIADSEIVDAYLDARLGVPADADPIGAAEVTAETVRVHQELPEVKGGADEDGVPVEQEEKPMPMDERQSTGFTKVRVEGTEVTGAPTGRNTDKSRLMERRLRGKSSAQAADPGRR